MSKKYTILVTSADVSDNFRRIFNKYSTEFTPVMKSLGEKFEGQISVDLSKLEIEICSCYDLIAPPNPVKELDTILDDWCYLRYNRIKHLGELREEMEEKIKDYDLLKEDVVAMVESIYRKRKRK